MRMPLCLLLLAVVATSADAQKADDGVSKNQARIFITDSKSWEIAGGGGGSSGGFGGATRGGARPQTAEIIKTFGERCPEVTVNNKQERADYVVLLDHEGGKGWLLHDNKVAVFNRDGDTIVSHSTRSLGNAVKDACDAIKADWPSRRARSASTPGETPAGAEKAPSAALTELEVISTPAGADIELDGNFVGNTPSSIRATVGRHQIVVNKPGYQPWERNITVSGGNVRLAAELEPAK